MREDMHNLLEIIVSEYIKNNAFSACSIGVLDMRRGDTVKYIFNFGHSGGNLSHLVDNKTVFDLASLTKPLVTTLSILSLVQSEIIQLDDYVVDYLKLEGEGAKEVQIRHLLEHTSGLAAHYEYFRSLIHLEKDVRKKRLLETIQKENLLTEPGKTELYSDLGFILLGQLVEKVSGDSLNGYWEKEIIRPLGVEKGLYFAQKKNLDGIVLATTGSCLWSNKELSGIVHDDNCRSIGGVAGHAGLFGTTESLLKLLAALMKMYGNSYSHPAFTIDVVRKRLKENHGRFVLGFDTPTGATPSSGQYFSNMTIGHLGFTGTSFWMDCRQKIAIVLLTNRVLCGEDLSWIRQFRPVVHNLIMEKLNCGKEV